MMKFKDGGTHESCEDRTSLKAGYGDDLIREDNLLVDPAVWSYDRCDGGKVMCGWQRVTLWGCYSRSRS